MNTIVVYVLVAWMIATGAFVAGLCFVWRMAYISLKAEEETKAYYKDNPGRGGDYR